MSADEPTLTVRRNDEADRYEGWLADEQVSVIDFRRVGDTLMITHTGTEPRWRGHGLARQTTRQALDDIREQGLRLRALCPFTVDYLDRHPEYADLQA